MQHTEVLDVPPIPILAIASSSLNSVVPNSPPLSSTDTAKPGPSGSAGVDSIPLTLSLITASSTSPPTNPAFPKSLELDIPSVPSESHLPARSKLLDNFVLHRYENIIKSKSDKREYRGLVLSNRMKVLLASDNAAEMSAATLRVNVGHLSDPDEVPGLAHFCEHMLFLGTEKYPQENEYNKFLSEHGGWANAHTGTDRTEFYFEVLPPHLGTVLDIFAQFFICPLFTESATERELCAVDSEHQNYVQCDDWRLLQVDRSAAIQGHPYRKFGTGNRQTLESVPKEKGLDVRQELLKFHQQWYSANIMALAVIGKESLDNLEALVAPLFSSVKDSSVSPPWWAEHPFPPALRGRRTYVEPVADIRTLAMYFPVPEYGREHYVGRSHSYLVHLINHEGPGSLLSALKTRGWCDSVGADMSVLARGFGVFEIVVDLTEEGVQHVDDIVALTFQYIAMLRSRGPQREIWEEQTELIELAFRFEDSRHPVELVQSLVDVLQEFPRLSMEHVLSTWRVTKWSPDLIEEVLAQFTPRNVRVQIVAECFADKCTQEEPWYGTKFVEENIEPDKIKEWESLSPNPEFHLPPTNEFVPSRVELEGSSDPTCGATAPEIIRDTPFVRLWFMQDNEFQLPKACIDFKLNSPLPAQSARNVQLTAIWGMLVEDSLDESTYAANQAGVYWGLSGSIESITITISGFDEKQHLLLEMVMDRIVTFKPDPRRFAVMKENLIRDIKNRDMDQPFEADEELDSCLSERVCLTPKQNLDAIESLTVEMLVDYMPRFLRSVYVEGIAFGNLTRARALRLAEIVEDRIPKDAVPVLAQELLLSRALEIEEGSYYLREITNAVHTASCAVVYVECGVYDTRSAIVLELLGKILQEPCYNILRTKEQLGYIVSGVVRQSCGVHGVVVQVQGDSHPGRLELRMEAFLQETEEYLEKLSEEEFVRHRSALSARRAERPQTIYHKKHRLWGEIMSQMYNFDRARIEVDVINSIAKEDIIQFYKKHIIPCSPVRRKLSVHVVSTADGHISDKTDKSDSDKHSSTLLDASAVLGPENVCDKDNESYNGKHRQSSMETRELSEPVISSGAEPYSDKSDKSDDDKHSSRSSEHQEITAIASDVGHDGDKSDNNDNHRQFSTEKLELSEPLISSSASHDSNKSDKSDNDKHSSRSSEGEDLSPIAPGVDHNGDQSDKSDNNDKHSKCLTEKQELSEPLLYSSTSHDSDKSDKSNNDKHSVCSSDGQNLSPIAADVGQDSDNVVKGNDKQSHCLSDKRDPSVSVTGDGVKLDKLDDDNAKQPIKITDLIDFKSRRRLYPRPTAFTSVPRRGS